MKIFRLSSRMLLLLVVIIASFLAAFIGQIVVTNYTQGPSLVGNQGLILRPSQDVFQEIAANADEILLQREGTIEVYAQSRNQLILMAKGVQATSDGMVIALPVETESATDLIPAFVRNNAGELYAVTETWEDSTSPALFISTETTNARPVTFAATSTLEPYIPYPLVRFSKQQIVFSHGKQVNPSLYLSSDQVNTYQYLSNGENGDLMLTEKAEVAGMVFIEDGQPKLLSSTYLDAKLKQVLREQDLVSPVLGVHYIDLAHGVIPESIELESHKGAYITNAYLDQSEGLRTVLPTSSPAYTAGVRLGDIIYRVDGEELTKDYTLSDAIQASEPGDEIELEVKRDDIDITIQVTLQ